MRKILFLLLMCSFLFLGLYLPQEGACSSTSCSVLHHFHSNQQEQISFGKQMGKVIKERGMDTNKNQIKTLVIDPGHGGKDEGCNGNGSIEKTITLAISKKLGAAIKANYPSIQVIYTRSKDIFVPLHKRAELANRNNADLFISVHCNALSNANYIRGSETYVMGLHTADENLEVAKRENASILLETNYEEIYQGFDPYTSEGHIFLSMYQNAYLEQSILLANSIERQFKKNRKSRGVKQAGFVVLRQTAMPSVLVETGYLTNKKDRDFLATASGQEAVANAILKAFTEYKNTVEDISTTPVKYSMSESNLASTIEFKVQLASSKVLLDTDAPKWQKLNETIEIRLENNIYKYVTQSVSSYEAAQTIKEKVQSQGFSSAFVVAYRTNQRIDIKDATRMISQNSN